MMNKRIWISPPPLMEEEKDDETPVQEQEDSLQEQSFYENALEQPQEQVLRRSERARRKPNYLDNYYLL